MFRGRESSKQNRIISISSILIEFWCFGLPAALGVGWLGGWGWGVVGGAPHTCAHTRVRTHTHAHACVVNMIIPCKWLLPLDFREIPGIPYDVICVCACVRMRACACVCMWVGGSCHHPLPPSTHPPTP